MASEWIQTVEGVRSATQAVGQRAEMRKHANLAAAVRRKRRAYGHIVWIRDATGREVIRGRMSWGWFSAGNGLWGVGALTCGRRRVQGMAR